jgi:predicted cupin superfamily sugar epimerase
MELLPWARLLLALVLRDLERGDIALGWGKAKGFGTLRLMGVDNRKGTGLHRALPAGIQWQSVNIPDFKNWLREQLDPGIEFTEDHAVIKGQ